MDLNQRLVGASASDLFEAQAHIYKHILNYANSMALGCALELGIPDIIHSHGNPITLQELVLKLNIPIEKTFHLQRLMRLLIYSKFFAIIKFHDHENDQDVKQGYALTISSKLLLSNNSEKPSKLPSFLPFANLILDPEFITPWQFFGKWFKGNDSTAFETAFGTSIWGYTNKNPRFNNLFNDAMNSNSQMMGFVIKDNKEIFQDLGSLVDVGGGTGFFAKILIESFPCLDCVVFDLPHVVNDMVDTRNLKYVGGDMFSSIPSTDAIILKNILHDWSDEDSLKILKRCKEAISLAHGKGKGKVIIIDMVIDDDLDHGRHEIIETKLIFDLMMMVEATGKERTKVEWEKLFLEAGFNRYKITNIFGLISIIEVFP